MALAACSAPTRPDSGSKSGPKSQPTTLKLEQVTSGLTIPWELAFTPDGSLYFTERPGRVDKLTPAGKLVPIPFQQPHDVYQDAESGLMGMALAPSFPDSPLIYLCYSYLDEEGHPRTQIARFTLEEGALADQKTLLVFPDAGSHNGCRLAFGPDGRLYGTIGDFAHPEDAQDLGVLAGKTVRINPDGSIPPDNPFVGKAGARPEIWTYGHRNPQGLAFDPASGMLYSTEHGQDTDDELNLLEPGNNYGWPIVRGTDDGGGKYTPALASYYPCPYTPPASETCDPFSTIAISSLTFYQGAMFPDWQGDILFVSLKTGRLYHVTLSPDGRSVADSEVVLDDKDATYPADAQLEHDYGRLRAIAVAPDGSVYISTSNGDGQDFLLRLSGE